MPIVCFVRVPVKLRGGRESTYEIGAADDAHNLAIANDWHTLDPRRLVRAWRKPLRGGEAGPQSADSAEQQKHRDRGDCEPISALNLHRRVPET